MSGSMTPSSMMGTVLRRMGLPQLGAAALSASLLASLALASAGCETNAYCFDCGSGGSSTGGSGGSGGATGGSGGVGLVGGSGGDGGCGLFGCGGGSGGDMGCQPTNGGIEICDDLDNDCDGDIDDIDGIDYASGLTCGTCKNNCFGKLQNCAIAGVECDPGPDPGQVPGTCSCAQCAQDYFDLDNDPAGGCEYFCQKTAQNDSLCNNKDDDCDGQIDEDVDLCTSVDNCGACGNKCSVVNGTGECAQSGAAPCTTVNTQCEIASCSAGYWDLDGSFATGCEYQCDLTNGGVEVCGDGLDNDCDGKIDGADDLSGDPNVGKPCFGDPDGECATAVHQGVTACVSNTVQCTGANVLKQDQVAETCNGKDDDCDGVVDDSPTDTGASCGVSAIFPCQLGTQQCVAGALSCVGAVNPGVESCNGQDDDCDGQIDFTIAANSPPADSIGTCNVPPAAPAGATSACTGGQKACVGGVIDCVGDVGPQSPSDQCGVDANCDGALTNQPNLQSDVSNCGSCGNNCYAGAVQSIWGCNAGTCQFQGCQPGFYDLDGNQTCEYACNFVSAQEVCNGQDDDCDGQVDEGVVAPQASQVCGTSPVAIASECKGTAQGGQVQIQCQAGAWKCTFPANVCPGGCSSNDEVCDTLDNDCDGLVNENVPNFNQACASDDGLPQPGHGACKTTGTFVCAGPNATTCSATKASCAGLPGGCTEQCDGVDNDCDGVIDETFNAKGSDPAFFVKPTVTKLTAMSWMYTYEASRPSATSVVPGTGNGFHTSAPAGNTLDKTKSCSVASKIPWFNVTPNEVEQTCAAAGGTICTSTQWQAACQVNGGGETNNCTYGYNPNGAACTSGFAAGKFCNLGPSFDFSAATAGDQDGLLPTASASLQNCWADWAGLQGNGVTNNKLFDVTGNLREIVKVSNTDYRLMGGAFNSASEAGATCTFAFYSVTSTFKYFDTGFRCCFAQDPTL